MKKIFAMLLTSMGLASACAQNFENTDVEGFASLVDSAGVVVLDVRTADEFAEGHIAGAVNIDWFSKTFADDAANILPKDNTIAVYCRSGRRSASAATTLAELGYKPVNLKGGIIAWTKAGKPTTKD